MLEQGAVRREVAGTPQGGVISPLLANVYPHRLDWEWQTRGSGVLVRYADDLVVMCRTRREAEDALRALTAILAELGARPQAGQDPDRAPTRGRRGAGLPRLPPPSRAPEGPASKAHPLPRPLALTRGIGAGTRADPSDHGRKRLRLPVEWIVQDLNRYLRGWGGYFRCGHSAHHFSRISNYAVQRLALFVAKHHQRKAGYGLSVVVYMSPNRMGLVNLDGMVVAPRANKPWREKPNVGGERRR